MLAHADAGHAGGDRLELAADLFGSVGLHVKRVMVRSAARQEDDQARLGFAEGAGTRGSGSSCQGTTLQQARQRQANQPETAGPQQLTPRQSLAGLRRPTVDGKHVPPLLVPSWKQSTNHGNLSALLKEEFF